MPTCTTPGGLQIAQVWMAHCEPCQFCLTVLWSHETVISKYVNDLQLSYIKLDFAIANSAYLHDPEQSRIMKAMNKSFTLDRGCWYYSNYMRMLQLMDELHAAFLICSSIALWSMGPLQCFWLCFDAARWLWLDRKFWCAAARWPNQCAADELRSCP